MLSSKKLSVPEVNPSANLFAVNSNDKNFYAGISYARNKFSGSNTFENKLAKEIMHVQEEERLKLGRELHDSVNPLLSVAKIYLGFINVSTKKNRDSKMQAASALLSAIENIRSISSALAVSQKANDSLEQLIKDMVKSINHTGVFKISFKIARKKEIKDISPEIKITLYRIIQEQLNNTLKYSKAKNVQIKLLYKSHFINLIIKDDGIGYDAAKRTKGIGLINISERVNVCNGKMQITTVPGKGFCLVIILPLAE